MSTAEPTDPPCPPPSVFPRDALRTYGLEVWYDESGLDGGDAGDRKIRRLIRECDFFMPVIPAQLKPTVFVPRSRHA
jgi:hypothetical protein